MAASLNQAIFWGCPCNKDHYSLLGPIVGALPFGISRIKSSTSFTCLWVHLLPSSETRVLNWGVYGPIPVGSYHAPFLGRIHPRYGF